LRQRARALVACGLSSSLTRAFQPGDAQETPELPSSDARLFIASNKRILIWGWRWDAAVTV